MEKLPKELNATLSDLSGSVTAIEEHLKPLQQFALRDLSPQVKKLAG
jgi:hypothetical protein